MKQKTVFLPMPIPSLPWFIFLRLQAAQFENLWCKAQECNQIKSILVEKLNIVFILNEIATCLEKFTLNSQVWK